MEIIEMFDCVLVRTGTYPALDGGKATLSCDTEGAVVEIFGDQDLFMVDIGSSSEDWDTIDIKRDDIIKVLTRS